MFSDQVIGFYKSLSLHHKLPDGVEVLNPYRDANTFLVCQQFYQKFYHDHKPRTIILGINPGRFGGGITGVPFTDPVKLEQHCGIPNNLIKKAELSADFIYRMIEAFGGAAKFYNEYFISAVCPLGFTKDGKNLNYYDQPDLQHGVYNFIIDSLKTQLQFSVNIHTCYCLGEGQNYKFISKLNAEYSFFKKIIPLPHPRFIMQYRRKRVDEFVNLYLENFREP